MNSHTRARPARLIPLLMVLSMLLTSLLSAQTAQAAPPPAAPAESTAQTATTVTLDTIDDARTQAGSPNTNFGSGFLWVGQPNNHYSFVQFDLSQLPAGATVTGAGLQLTFTGAYTGTNEVEVGRADGAWDELNLTWATQPAVTWGGPVETVTSTGLGDSSIVTWNVTPLVQAWQSGTAPNYGFVLRGNGGELKAAYAKENGTPDRLPRLVLALEMPADDGQPRPDLGDAPDSTNHHGQTNTAYPAAGVLGQFPTVWNVPAGQVAGPRHVNQTMEGWLGNFISREGEADQGPDQDAPRNNILRNTNTGAIADVADNDRGDDGWRNRTIKFFDCKEATLDIRVSKGPNATRNFMYLNVWFDGNRDGDWADLGQCQADENEPAQASYEWIVQNYIIDMTAVPAGGSLDFGVNTEKVLNSTPNQVHWMRFTLSEEPATQPVGGGLPDGRGPHPDSPLKSYQFGETEDVIQKPPPAGEDGQLLLEKRVITEGSPVPYAGEATFEIRLRHDGGTQPVQAQIRDELEYPLHVLPHLTNDGAVLYVQVTSPTGGVAPLAGSIDYNRSGPAPINQVVNWQGTLEPNAEVQLRFTVHVHPLCTANQQTAVITNVAKARADGGDPLTAEATFVAACPGYNPSNIQIDPEPLENPIDLDDLLGVQWQGRLRNNHAVPVTLGAVFEPNDANVAAAGTTGFINRPILERITLAPNEERLVNLDLRMDVVFTDELMLADEFVAGGTLSFCFLEDESTACPDASTYPNLVVKAPPVKIHYRPSDLGDAPDSTNHAGAAMAAYPGVQAEFPTVFDPNTGLPEGPLHRHPRPFHLGQRVSREAEADIGPDQDPLNNIVPAANDPDNDRGDDGTNFALWNLNNCQTTNLPVQVFISPAAVNYFQQLGTSGYLNIWLDSNRDGDWADAFPCTVGGGQQPAPEHIVIDAPINVVGLGAGLHNLPIPTGLVPWNNNEQPSWVRITLSEIPSNKTLQAGNMKHGDGRGYPNGFKTGETEDYFYRPATAGGGPDLDVQMTARTRKVSAQEPGLLQSAAADKLGNFEIQLFKINYGNIGSQTASGGVLTFNKPPALREGQLVLLQAPGLDRANFSLNFEEIKVTLMDLAPNQFGTITLGWTGCLTCTVTAAQVQADVTAAVEVTLDDDIDTSNNGSSATARGLLSSPIIGLVVPRAENALCNNEVIEGLAVTNRTTVELRGRAAPNRQVEIYDGTVLVATVQSDANGNFSHTITLSEGLHNLLANYIKSPRDAASGLPTGRLRLAVKPSLPFDPASLCFVDSQNRSMSLPILGFSWGATQSGSWLRSGESYQVSVSGLGSAPNQAAQVVFNDVVLSSLLDADGDGIYTGVATFPASVQAAGADATGTLSLIIDGPGSQSRHSTELTSTSSGTVTDQRTGQPLANAEVTLLQAQDVEDGTTVATAFTQQGETQITAGDGSYSFTAATGIYRIDVQRDGYQPYRSADIDVSEATLNQAIALTPQVLDATTHTVYITANGYEPATLSVTPGSVIEFINIDLDEHSVMGTFVTSGVWDSGMLATGASYKVQLNETGTFSYRDSSDAAISGQLVVEPGSLSPTSVKVFLPLVTR